MQTSWEDIKGESETPPAKCSDEAEVSEWINDAIEVSTSPGDS